MMHLQSLVVSLLLKGRTRTATFTDDMMHVFFYDGDVTLFKWTLILQINILCSI